MGSSVSLIYSKTSRHIYLCIDWKNAEGREGVHRTMLGHFHRVLVNFSILLIVWRQLDWRRHFLSLCAVRLKKRVSFGVL